MSKLSPAQKNELYCEFLQDPETDVKFLTRVFKKHRQGRQPLSVKEDFCGSFFFCAEWIRSDPRRRAIGVDIDWEPLQQGYQTNYTSLRPDQRARLKIIQGNVMAKHGPGVDINFASNFSYNCLKKRSELKTYFRAVHRSLNRHGIFVMDHFGGPDTQFPDSNTSTARIRGVRWYYEFELKRYNPNTEEGFYAIHFSRLKTRNEFKNVFTYDWRMWSLPELNDVLREVGFKDVLFYWEKESGEFSNTPKGETGYAVWVLHIVALK